MIDQQSLDAVQNNVSRYSIYQNKKSKMNESILIQFNPEQDTFTLHVYALIIPENNYRGLKSEIIDTRRNSRNNLRSSPLKLVSDVKEGSLSFIRYFIKNPAEKKHEEKLREKYPNKKHFRKKYFHPLLLVVAHYCNQYTLPQDIPNKEFIEKIQEIAIQFDELIQEEMHPTLRTVGSPLYLKGERNLISFHNTRELPENYIRKLTEEKMLQSIAKQKSYSILMPSLKGVRRELNEQVPLFQQQVDPLALTHIITDTEKLLSIDNNRFPLVIVGEPNVRRNLILNILNNANARFLILDPRENYGRLAMVNPRIRGYVLNKNFRLDILSTEGEKISKQVYAYWFAKIISYITNLKSELSKLIEANYLKIYFDEFNQSLEEKTFHHFATGELTSEGSSSSRRSEISLAKNALYTLGTYKEISHNTTIGESPIFESIFETKGTIIQFNKTDEQLSKTAYLFTILKLRSILSEDPKILVLENIDDIIGQNSKSYQNTDLTDLILGLAEDYQIILGVRSPAKIAELFKTTKSKFINRLLTNHDRNLLFNEYKISKFDTSKTSKLTEREFLVLVPEFSTPSFIKIESLPDIKMQIIVSKKNPEQKLQARIYNKYNEIAPELQRIMFDLICLLKERPDKAIAEQGIEKLIDNSTKEDLFRAKEIALQESFVKKLIRTSIDSAEKIPCLQLTERGEEFYKGYLNLQERIPKITFSSLSIEKNFEQDILEKLETCQSYIDRGINESAKDLMDEIIVRMLGTFPEADRFTRGNIAAEIMNQWYLLESLQESNNYSRIERIFNKFQGIIINGLKSLKHNLISNLAEDMSAGKKSDEKVQTVDEYLDAENNPEESEYEVDIPLSKEAVDVIQEKDPWK
ncbi:MAG: hypothetical protein FK733_05125, partial [Asgard group archaeon]|nr:hypothetical protein [Asgard group archaeon]